MHALAFSAWTRESELALALEPSTPVQERVSEVDLMQRKPPLGIARRIERSAS